jgi:hypothetical protein
VHESPLELSLVKASLRGYEVLDAKFVGQTVGSSRAAEDQSLRLIVAAEDDE